ncbi:TcaA second domain-containing protein [Thalassobacillus devorans]|uniref:TcaA second domain-containing protein n=1 Tax=Thalassobacillus devorans TaxID=279813 RepID=UPI000A1CF004|nr:zinc-ribbon domain-containing protein [Thalassobacillus devorans]
MNYCKECGAELIASNKFCLECGHPVELKAEPDPAQAVKPPIRSKSTSKLPKKKKIWSIVGIVVFFLLVTAYIIGADMTSKAKVVEKYENAVEEKDAKELAKFLVYTDTDEKVEEEDAKAFLNYLEENPDKAESLLNELKAQSDRTKRKEDELWEEWLEEEYFLTVVQDGKLLIFDQYRLSVKPAYVTFHADYKGTKVMNGEEEVYTATADGQQHEYGPLLPGIYQIKRCL